jgi:cytochrome P450
VASVLRTDSTTAGRNGIVITKRSYKTDKPGYRTYEVHQRERVGESTEKIKPSQFISDEYRTDPYPVLATLRENYPCYRDWLSNSYWVTQYNDVTSIFADEANFESRPKTWYYELEGFGRNLGDELPVLTAAETHIDGNAERIASELASTLVASGGGDLATGFAAPFALELLACSWGIPTSDVAEFGSRYWRIQRGTSWDPKLQQDGRVAMNELAAYFEPLIKARRSEPLDDVISAMVQLDEPANAKDLVATLLATDHESLHGSLANLWFLMLNHPEEFEKARSERRLLKLAYLETLRHSTPVISAFRFARQEVERFGKLIPEGARLICSAAAANRDPRIFKDPDTFIVDRKDMCQREPRGQYRADGLAAGIAFGLGKPSVHPAIPEDRPRSPYAINRDTVVTASQALLDSLGDIAIKSGATPKLSSLTIGEMHTCWKLPVSCKAR